MRSTQKPGTLTVKKADGHSEGGPLNDLRLLNAGYGWRDFAQPLKINTSSGEKFCDLRRARFLEKDQIIELSSCIMATSYGSADGSSSAMS